MKVLHINVTCTSGSTGGIIQHISQHLKARYPKCEVSVAYAVGERSRDNFKYIMKWEFFLVRAFRKLFGKTLLGSEIPTIRLIRYIKKTKPDIIHLHAIHHQTLHYKLLFRFLANYKGQVIYTLHDCWPFTGGCYHFTEAGCSPKLCLQRCCPQSKASIDCAPAMKNREYAFKKQWLNAVPNITFTAVSNWLAEEARQSFLHDKQIITVYNGIDTNVFRPLPEKKIERFTVISVAAYWTPRKHLDILLEMADTFADMDFLVVGTVSEAILPRANVFFIERTESREQLCQLYNRAHIFANFSTEETFGLVTAEAMACGLPAIAFNSTACAEIIAPGCGFAVNSKEEYKEVLRMLKNSDLTDYRCNCRRVVLEKYTTEIMAKNYIDLYNSLC